MISDIYWCKKDTKTQELFLIYGEGKE